MAFSTLNFFGASIGKATAVNILLPDQGVDPFPVLYLLHGLSDDYTIWHRRTSLERYVADLPLIVCMVDGGRSFYCNDDRPSGMKYEDHMFKDIVGLMDRTFRTIPHRRGRAIAGLSMGGYGSFMLALRHPDLYSVACSHSGALGFARPVTPWRPEIAAMLKGLSPTRYDIFRLATKLKKSKAKLAMRMDVGTEDFLLEQNRAFHRHLDKLKIAHEYAEYGGTHNWEYWDTHIRQTLDFVMAHLGK